MVGEVGVTTIESCTVTYGTVAERCDCEHFDPVMLPIPAVAFSTRGRLLFDVLRGAEAEIGDRLDCVMPCEHDLLLLVEHVEQTWRTVGLDPPMIPDLRGGWPGDRHTDRCGACDHSAGMHSASPDGACGYFTVLDAATMRCPCTRWVAPSRLSVERARRASTS